MRLLTVRKAVLLALFCVFPVRAAVEDDTLSTFVADHIAGGKWDFAYLRIGEFKPLMFRRREEGVSTVCIDSDPRRHLINWVTRKGCRVHQEVRLDEGYALSGECRLKWWKSHPIPVDVKLSWVDDKTFTMDILARNDPLLGYIEHTTATLRGECEAKP